MKKYQSLQTVDDTRKELVVCALNDLVMDAFKDNGIEVLVNILPNGTPMKDDGGKILTVGFFKDSHFEKYISVKDDSPAILFKRCSEVLYQMLEKEE